MQEFTSHLSLLFPLCWVFYSLPMYNGTGVRKRFVHYMYIKFGSSLALHSSSCTNLCPLAFKSPKIVSCQSYNQPMKDDYSKPTEVGKKKKRWMAKGAGGGVCYIPHCWSSKTFLPSIICLLLFRFQNV